MLRYVDVEALNLCAQPAVTPRSRLSILHLGQAVEELGPADAPGWCRVVARIAGRDVAGLVPAAQDGRPTLRPPGPPAREALIAQAVREWRRFAHGLGKADAAPFCGYVAQMRDSVAGEGSPGEARSWSAAALSCIVRNAAQAIGAYGRFAFSRHHQDYCRQARDSRQRGDALAPFWGFQPEERHPEAGDLLLCRGTADGEEARTHVVVSAQPGQILLIGGDVQRSVGLTRLAWHGAGLAGGGQAPILLLSNRVDGGS